MNTNPEILLAGAGPVGMAAALMAYHEGLNVHWFAPSATTADTRLMALSPRSVDYLKRLGVWERLPVGTGTAIRQVSIRRLGQKLLTIDARDYRLPAVGYALPMQGLMQALQDTLQHWNIQCHEGWSLQDGETLDAPDAPLTCTLHHPNHTPSKREASLLILARGTPNDTPIRPAVVNPPPNQRLSWLTCWREAGYSPWSWLLPHDDEGTGLVRHPYHLTGWMANVRHAALANDVATECFTQDGVVAVIPGGAGIFKAIVLKEHAPDTDVETLAPETFIQWLADALSLPAAGFTLVSPLQTFRPQLCYRQDMVQNRVVWLGNAAHTLSPVGGQGFNLGLHEAWQLMSTLAQHGVSPRSLQTFARQQKQETLSTLAASHWLTSAHHLSPAIMRGAGLLAKHFPVVSRSVGARLMFGRRAWLAGILR